jgi:hypothetical protein
MMLGMIRHLVAVPLLASPLALLASTKKVDWQAVEKIAPGTHIFVRTTGGWECAFQKATENNLFCTQQYPGSSYSGPHFEHVFSRADIVEVCVGEIGYCSAFDQSEGNPFLMGGLQAGGGWSGGYTPGSFAGAKLGAGGLTLDLQYDRVKNSRGFSTEGSWMIPVLRVPAYKKGKDQLFFRAYAEPGLGYRAGGNPFGQYASAKMLILFGKKWVDSGASPYVELQRRFPFSSPMNGDNRIAVGFMVAVCEHCGLD